MVSHPLLPGCRASFVFHTQLVIPQHGAPGTNKGEWVPAAQNIGPPPKLYAKRQFFLTGLAQAGYFSLASQSQESCQQSSRELEEILNVGVCFSCAGVIIFD